MEFHFLIWAGERARKHGFQMEPSTYLAPSPFLLLSWEVRKRRPFVSPRGGWDVESREDEENMEDIVE